MPVQQSDIRIFGSEGIPMLDTDTPVGGDVDLTTEMVFANIVNQDNLQVVSSNSSDAGDVAITGRNAAGAITSETVSLAGIVAMPTVINEVWSSLLIGAKQSSAAGVVAVEATTALFIGAGTVSGQSVILTNPPVLNFAFCVLRITAGTGVGFIGVILAYNPGSKTAYLNATPPVDNTSVIRISYGMVFRQDGNTEIMTVRRPFYGASAPAPQSPYKSLLEKVFVYNTNDVLTLNNVQLQQTLQSNVSISLGLDTALNAATAAAGNRTGASPVPMFTGTAVAVPGTALPTNSGIGVWLQLNLMPGADPVEAPTNLQIQGI